MIPEGWKFFHPYTKLCISTMDKFYSFPDMHFSRQQQISNFQTYSELPFYFGFWRLFGRKSHLSFFTQHFNFLKYNLESQNSSIPLLNLNPEDAYTDQLSQSKLQRRPTTSYTEFICNWKGKM